MKEYRIGEGAMDTHFGKENDCKLYMLKSNDGRNQEIWVKWDEWIRPNNIISEGSEMRFVSFWENGAIKSIKSEMSSRVRLILGMPILILYMTVSCINWSLRRLQQPRICFIILRKWSRRIWSILGVLIPIISVKWNDIVLIIWSGT